MSNSKFKQDLPPPGGYRPIQYLRIPAKTYFSGTFMFASFVVFQFAACYVFGFSNRRAQKMEVEERSTRLAILPMLCAEKDRSYLKMLRKHRDEEARLMKDTPGWKVGTYWGEPIFFTRPKDEWYNMTMQEFYAHNRQSDRQYALNFWKYL